MEKLVYDGETSPTKMTYNQEICDYDYGAIKASFFCVNID